MAKQVADVQIHASDSQNPLEDDNLDVSVDLIDEGLYLGNLACARDYKTLEKLQITHVLTIDVVPLPRSILDRGNLTFKYIKLADVPKEDLISQLPETNEFIKEAIADNGVVLVHCYFGVSRSAAVVVAYIMEKYRLCYEEAFDLVKSKRRFIHPNMGFQAQLKLFGHMGYRLNKDDPRFKQFRLKMAGQKLKQVKILPQQFADLVKPDPGLVRERPDPIVYRCKKCRRIVAGQTNIIPHVPKQVKVELAKKGIRPPPSNLTGLNCSENGQILIEKLKSLACQIMEGHSEGSDSSEHSHSDEGPSQVLDGYSETNLVDGHITTRDCPSACRLMWFVEPMAWMQRVQHELHGKLHCPKCQNKIGSFNWVMDPNQMLLGIVDHIARDCPSCRLMWFVEPMAWMQRVQHELHGKLHCPKCQNKIGSFNWVMGCKCPCGQKVAPAFYLVPSKVEWSNIVQNVQVTV